jgi:hypothetical protein
MLVQKLHHQTLNKQLGLRLKLYPWLRLVVIGTIKTTIIQINFARHRHLSQCYTNPANIQPAITGMIMKKNHKTSDAAEILHRH